MCVCLCVCVCVCVWERERQRERDRERITPLEQRMEWVSPSSHFQAGIWSDNIPCSEFTDRRALLSLCGFNSSKDELKVFFYLTEREDTISDLWENPRGFIQQFLTRRNAYFLCQTNFLVVADSTNTRWVAGLEVHSWVVHCPQESAVYFFILLFGVWVELVAFTCSVKRDAGLKLKCSEFSPRVFWTLQVYS